MRPLHAFRRLFTLVLFCILLPASARAQQEVTVRLHQPPPNQLKVADLWQVDLDNQTNPARTLTVYLRGTVDEATDGRIVEATTRRFQLAPGRRTVLGSEIQPIDAKYDESQKRYDYKTVFLRTGRAPTGSYSICVEVKDAATDEVLGTDCIEGHDIQVLQPPVLIHPFDESTVSEKLPSFTWTPPIPVAPGQQVRYTLRIVEILGRQTPYDAMTSNPAYFTRENIPTALFPFPISARPFREGQRYAWRVEAFGDRFPMGESEIWWFTYVPLTDPDITTLPDLPGVGKLRDVAVEHNTQALTDVLEKGPFIHFTPPKTGTSPVIGSFINEITRISPGILKINPDLILTAKGAIPKKIEDELFHSCFGQ